MADKPHPNSIHHGLKPDDAHYPPYTPASLARELSIMFGFIAFCCTTMLVYWFVWQAAQRRNAVKETARLEAMAARARARARVEAEKQHAREAKGGNEEELELRNNSNASPGRPLCEGSRRLIRNGTGANGLGFGDLNEDLVV